MTVKLEVKLEVVNIIDWRCINTFLERDRINITVRNC